MTDNEHDALAQRIKAAQDARGTHAETRDSTPESPANAGNMVIKHGSELFANVIVGLVLGLTIDYFLGTRPMGNPDYAGFGPCGGIFRCYTRLQTDYCRIR